MQLNTVLKIVNCKLKILLVLLVSITAIGYFVFSRNKEGVNDPSLLARLWNSDGDANISESAEDATIADLLEDRPPFIEENGRYINTKYSFSFALPSEYTPRMQTYDEAADILTFDAANGNGFQIFIMEYDEPAINPERIEVDVPGIVMKNIRTGTLDGAEMLVFESFESTLGETYEIWFARNGYLYQMMTYRDQAEDMNKVLDTWKFQ